MSRECGVRVRVRVGARRDMSCNCQSVGHSSHYRPLRRSQCVSGNMLVTTLDQRFGTSRVETKCLEHRMVDDNEFSKATCSLTEGCGIGGCWTASSRS